MGEKQAEMRERWEKKRAGESGAKEESQAPVNARLLLSNSQNVQSAGANKRHGGQRRFGNCVPLKTKQHRP
ncbi:MAG: hypothetical protein DMG96_17945 [Acidobacteria bacterium]|nr:MAG: hypothetical protein DMG96_17945 [Acidobacteriota bacterium]